MRDSDEQTPSGGDPQQLRFPLPSGTRVDHYVIREVLGAGGFGITYLAEHEGLGKLYAIKEYFPHAFSVRQGRSVRPTSASDGTYKWGLDRFLTEARALAKFKHVAIVDITSIFEANGTAYIVLAYERGLDMTQWLKRLGRPPTQEELDRLLTPLLSALEEIHRHSMMHRDISPDNLLIREDGRPVLIDFGSARESIRGRARALSAIVKHGYSPPEQYSSRPELQGAWTDVYALAATLYRAVSGKLPPDATERIVRDDLEPLVRLARAPYRPSFLDAVDRGLRMKVEERPQSIVEWRESLFRPEGLRQPSSAAGALRDEELPAKAAPARSTASPPSARQPSARLARLRPSERVSLKSPDTSREQRVRTEPGAGEPARPQGLSSGGSRRLSGGSSLRKSERPDMSWVDHEEDNSLTSDEPTTSANTGQAISYAVMGLIAGACAGGVLAIVLASIISTECFADRCIMRYLTSCSIIGALAGVFVGWRLGTRPAEVAADAGRSLGLGGPSDKS